MSHLIIHTNRLLNPLGSITLPKVNWEQKSEVVFASTKRFFAGTLVADFFTIFSSGL